MNSLVEVKSLGGTNFFRADVALAIVTSPSGGTVIVLQGGTNINSTETPKVIAARIEAVRSAAPGEIGAP